RQGYRRGWRELAAWDEHRRANLEWPGFRQATVQLLVQQHRFQQDQIMARVHSIRPIPVGVRELLASLQPAFGYRDVGNLVTPGRSGFGALDAGGTFDARLTGPEQDRLGACLVNGAGKNVQCVARVLAHPRPESAREIAAAFLQYHVV